MTTSPDDTLRILQHEVQRLLGRCVLRLQQYELLIKAIVARHEISGPPHALEEIRAKRVDKTARKTLGKLVGDLCGSYLVANGDDTPLEDATDSPEAAAWINIRMSRELPEAEFARIENELAELVQLRNNLVHCFIDQHDIGSLDGCRSACDALVADYERIDQAFGQLREWAEHMGRVQRELHRLFQSDEILELIVNGIKPDGTVEWPIAGIVYSLRAAVRELAVEGWVSIIDAGKWIAEREPEQLPAKYGCSSWRQAVHESGAFEIRYFEKDGRRSAYYRELGDTHEPTWKVDIPAKLQ